ncbi:MAG: hypothetical protein E7487_04935 [Ruminococcaceae bacterium]|nr:hypothetical protein [Oscillospiraceae bacterium]
MDPNVKTSGTVTAGFGSADITPWEGVHLAGAAMGQYRPARFVRHKLYAKASVFKGEKTVCIIGLDVTIIIKKYADYIKDKLVEEFNIDRDAIMVFAIQSHSAPSVGGLMLDDDYPLEFPPDKEFILGHNSEYSQFASDQAVEAARKAFANLRPLKMDVKSGNKHGLAFCRRAIMTDGSLQMFPANSAKAQPLGPKILYLESPADDEVGVACFKDENMNIVGSLLHFTCHPVNDFCTPSLYHAVTPDWPGTWSEQLQSKLNIGNIPMVLNGCCGNINPYDPYTPDYIMDSERMGSELANLAERIILSMEFNGADEPLTVDYFSCDLPLEYRDIPEERMKEVEKLLEGGEYKIGPDGNADIDWFLAASTYSAVCCKKREPLFQYPIQVFRVGGLAIVSMAGEPFTDGQLSIKLRSKAALTYVTHCANKYVGYLAHDKGYDFDGHGTNSKYTFWAKMARGSLEKICDKIVEGIDSLF